MMIEIAQPPVAKPDRHYTVAGFPLHEAGGSAPGVTRNSWRSGCLVLHSVLPLVEFFKRFDGLVTRVAATAAFPHNYNPNRDERPVMVNGKLADLGRLGQVAQAK